MEEEHSSGATEAMQESLPHVCSTCKGTGVPRWKGRNIDQSLNAEEEVVDQLEVCEKCSKFFFTETYDTHVTGMVRTLLYMGGKVYYSWKELKL